MYNIKTYNNIAPEGLKLFDESYKLNENGDYDAILLRSQNLHNIDFPRRLKAIARAGAGVNNIPIDKATEAGIVVFNTPGANANAVKELVIASMILSVRPIIRGALWVKNLKTDNLDQTIEANKKQFKGTELEGKTLGVIGLGSIGSMVANDAYRLGMNVIGYDPYVSVNTAWNISRRVKRALHLDEIFKECDFISIHIPLNEETKNIISKQQIYKMKKDTVLLNFSRKELIDNEAIIEALDQNELGQYVTDFADETLLKHDKVLVLPHLGASTNEAEVNCAKVAVRTLTYFLETGNIINAVNFAPMELGFNSPTRFTLIHHNVPKMLSKISTIAGQHDINIDNMMNRNSGEYAYTIVDISNTDPTLLGEVKQAFDRLDSMIYTRIIRQPSARF